MKSFADVSAEDAKCMARYTACSFEEHQPRFICSNAFEGSLEPCSAGTHLELPKLLELLSPRVFLQTPMSSSPQIMSNVVLFGHHQVMIRLADGNATPAKIIPY
eukprot:3762295-Amphidinium_carterae.1